MNISQNITIQNLELPRVAFEIVDISVIAISCMQLSQVCSHQIIQMDAYFLTRKRSINTEEPQSFQNPYAYGLFHTFSKVNSTL